MNEAILIYAAGPIDLGTDIPNWRQRLTEKLTAAGVTAVLFDPSTAYKTSSWGQPDRNRSGYIEEINRQALVHANYFVVCLPGKVPSVGTPMELDWANERDIPVLLITDIPTGKSVYLDNRVTEAERFFCGDLLSKTEVDAAISAVVDTIIKRATGPQKLMVRKADALKKADIDDIRRELAESLEKVDVRTR